MMRPFMPRSNSTIWPLMADGRFAASTMNFLRLRTSPTSRTSNLGWTGLGAVCVVGMPHELLDLETYRSVHEHAAELDADAGDQRRVDARIELHVLLERFLDLFLQRVALVDGQRVRGGDLGFF